MSSKYEDRWRKQNKNIYDLYLHNHQESPPKNRDLEFDFEPLSLAIEPILRREVGEGWFVNLERFYASTDRKKWAIRSSFGDFAYPEKKYIWLDETHARYFGAPPIPTYANHRAHSRLKEWLA